MPTGSDVFEIPHLRSPIPAAAAEAVQRLTGLRSLSRIYDSLVRGEDESFFETVRRALDLGCDVAEDDLRRVPAGGPVVVVANHPFGAAEGIVLARVLGGIRRDVRVLANHLLGRIPELREDVILVDPFRPGTNPSNVGGLRRAIAHVSQGGMLVTFPAGTVSHLQLDRMTVTDPLWSRTIARVVRRTRATVLPVYFPGSNGPLFQLAGLLHPSLRTALLPHALLDRRHTWIEMRIGRPIAWSRLSYIENDDELITHLRRRTYVLRHRSSIAAGATTAKPQRARMPIAPPRPAQTLAREVTALREGSILASAGDLDVILATADRIPNVLQEIGRLREITFRAVGEGTGKASDLDGYDAFYLHLFLWNRGKEEVVGAYRLGVVEPIMKRHGVSGLYTSTLFRYSPEFFRALGHHGVELGRSWIRPEYQKSYAPLLLLWRGIGAYVASDPDRCVLFGPASISADYRKSSRALMSCYLMRDAASDLSKHVQPRQPFELRSAGTKPDDVPSDFDEIHDLLMEIENGQRGVPVLLRQYLNIGGRVAALNVDRAFSDALDALVIVDLRATPEKTLARYLTPEGARAFLFHHQTKHGARRDAIPRPA